MQIITATEKQKEPESRNENEPTKTRKTKWANQEARHILSVRVKSKRHSEREMETE